MLDNVLIIAYQFPPMGGSGVQRTSKFVKHLPKFNYEPIVLTRKLDNVSLIDESLLEDIPKGTKIFRTNAYDRSDSSNKTDIFSKVLGRKVLIPDQARLWAMSLHNIAIELVNEHRIEIIYSTSYPYSDHLLALHIKKQLGDRVKWVCDFRDEWSNNPYTKDNPYNKVREKIEFDMEKEVIEYADCVIANTPVMRQNFIDIHNVSVERQKDFYTIPNGYDVDDFDGIDREPVNNDKFTITYTGAIYGRRKPDYFFNAVRELIETNQIDRNKIVIKFIGNYKKEELLENVARFNISDYVEIYDYMPHKEALSMLCKSDALLLIEGGGVGSDAFYTGKIFEYMYTNRPVIAVLPEGCATSLVLDTKIGLVSYYEDMETTKQNILKLYKMWENKEIYNEQDFEKIKGYERVELTKQLSEIFDKLV